MADNFFQLKNEKSEVLVFAPDRFVSKVMETLGRRATFAKSGTWFDSTFTLDARFKSRVCSGFYSYFILPSWAPCSEL